MKKIIWLCSWYPSEDDHFIGDFIQRHAYAASEEDQIHVIHICESSTYYPSSYIQAKENLTEEIHYLTKKTWPWLRAMRYMQFQYAAMQRFQRKHGRPDGIHVHVPMKAGILAMLYSWLFRIPYVVSEHYGIYNKEVEDHFETRSIFFRFLSKHIISQSKQLTTVSQALNLEMKAHGLEKRTIQIPNVVNTNLFQFTSPPKSKTFRFIHISGMSPLKNVEGILDAFDTLRNSYPETELILVGDIRDHLVQKVKATENLRYNVHFRGVCAYPEVALEIQQAHALVLFSDSESQSCVVLEALCSGRPCIVPATGGVQELISSSNGFQVEVRNTSDLCNKMKDMIVHYADFQCQEIAQVASEQYSYHAIGKQFKQLYQKHFG